MRWCIRGFATDSRRSRLRSDAPASRYFRRRSKAATATSNSSSARAVAEHLTIDHVGHRGDGVVFTDGHTVFVPYTLPGETIEAGPVADHPDRRLLLRVESASPERIAPFCRYFGACGGCAIQHWQPDSYAVWKRRIVVDTLSRTGIQCPVDDLIDAHGAGRRRITAHARRGGDGD